MSVDVAYELLPDGTVRLESPDGVSTEPLTPDDLMMYLGDLRRIMQWLGIEGIRFTAKPSVERESEEDDSIGFEDDLDYLLTKNAELYRRLAR